VNVFKLNPNKIILAVLICAVVMLSGLSYAFYKLSLVGSEEITLISGSLELSFSDSSGKIIKLDNAEPIIDEEGLSIEAYQFSLRNVGDLDSSYTLYLDDSLGLDQQKMNDKYIKYVLEKNGEVGDIKYLSDNPLQTTDGGIITRMIDSGELASNEEVNYTLRLWIADTADNGVMGTSFKANLRIEATQKVNKIAGAFIYNEDTCVTGNEDTCVLTECYKDKTSDSCPVGTIIKYRVNDDELLGFNVLHDNGEKITMLSQDRLIESVAWNSASHALLGPIGVLNALEERTANWSNVSDLEYESGVTIFHDNPYTGCSFVNGNFQCTNNIYTLPSRVAKARLITLQEAMYAGCANSRYSCPKWMWANGEMITMSAISDSRVYSISDIFMDVSIDSTHDVRAVVDIFK